MNPVNNIEYKNILFTRSDGIYVNIKVSLNNPSDLNENFLVLSLDGVKSIKEMVLFSWINKKRWTLNEFIFFALNNRLCLKILDKQNVELTSYGICGTSNRVFGFTFGLNFN